MIQIAVLSIVASATTFSAPAADDPVAILKAAAEACRNVQNGRYHAVWELKDEHSPQKVEGDVAFMHWPPDVETPPPPQPKPNADGSIPATAMIKAKLRTDYNADFRIDLAGGRTLAFNREAGVILDPSAKLYRVMKTTDGGESLIRRDNAGALLITPLLDPEMLEKFATSKQDLAAGARQKVADVDCDVVTFHLPKPDAATDLSITVWIGADDHLPRQLQHEMMTDGKSAMKQTTTISNLQCNVRMNGSQFDVQAPEGFKVENVQRESPPELLAAGTTAPGFALQDVDGRRNSRARSS
jgi:outer membrane lipoprotein-sorting protein